MFRIIVLDVGAAVPVFERLVDCVVLPSRRGEISVLSFHQSMLVRLKKGIIKADKERIAIKEGVAKMQGDKLTVLAETNQKLKS